METLEEMRKSIDNIDNAIIAMFAERFKITDRVGLYKAKNHLDAKDPLREKVQYERMSELADQYGLDPNVAKSYLSSVISSVIRNHKHIASKF